MIPVIMSGGSGTRLWPVSRSKMPKQFVPIFDETLQTKTLKRLIPYGDPWVVTVKEMGTLCLGNFLDLGLDPNRIVFEPQGRNTAPAIGLMCRIFELNSLSEEVMGVFPSDQKIENEMSFKKSMHVAESKANEGFVLTLGVVPQYPATGYGYIEVEKGKMDSPCKVKQFYEKPNIQKAKEYLKSGNYYWNSGMFIFKVSTMIELFKIHQKENWEKLSQLKKDLSNLKEIYESLEPISIDFGIIEKIPDRLICVPSELGWSDVGSWDEVARIGKSEGKVFLHESLKPFVYGEKEKTYAFVGIDEELILVDTKDALLVLKKGESQKVKEILDSIKVEIPKVLEEREFDFRPWGEYEVLCDRENFKSKIIDVRAGQQLSYQSHEKRSEHWIVIEGEPEVVLDDKVHLLKPGDHIHIPAGAKHRMRNPNSKKVRFIEVQTGSYFGEDDIVRYQDDYNRH